MYVKTHIIIFIHAYYFILYARCRLNGSDVAVDDSKKKINKMNCIDLLFELKWKHKFFYTYSDETFLNERFYGVSHCEMMLQIYLNRGIFY